MESINLDFGRQDGATKARHVEFIAAQESKEKMDDYIRTCAFSGKDQAWWNKRENVNADNIEELLCSEIASPGLIYARYKNWEINDWQQYVSCVSFNRNAAKDMADLGRRIAENRRAEYKLKTTGLTKETEKLLTAWRSVHKQMSRNERIVTSIGSAFRRACGDVVSKMETLRKNMVGPWENYFAVEKTPLIDEASEEERKEVERLMVKEHKPKATAESVYRAIWEGRRKMTLASIAKGILDNNDLATPPKEFFYNIDQMETQHLLAAEPVLPKVFRSVVPKCPDLIYYNGGRPMSQNKRQRSEMGNDEEKSEIIASGALVPVAMDDSAGEGDGDEGPADPSSSKPVPRTVARRSERTTRSKGKKKT
jgi:hypothetical protein